MSSSKCKDEVAKEIQLHNPRAALKPPEKSSSADAVSRFCASSVAAAVAETFTLPTDVAKVRLQVQSVGACGTPMYSGMVDCLVKTKNAEGLGACWYDTHSCSHLTQSLQERPRSCFDPASVLQFARSGESCRIEHSLAFFRCNCCMYRCCMSQFGTPSEVTEHQPSPSACLPEVQRARFQYRCSTQQRC